MSKSTSSAFRGTYMLKLFHAGWSLCHRRELAGKQQKEMLHKNTVQMDELLFIKIQLQQVAPPKNL